MRKHTDSQEVKKRLKRASGHLMKVIDMVDNEDCMKVAQQLHAVSNAILSAKKIYIQDHVEHCLSEAKDSKSFDRKINEFKEITRYI